MSDLRTMMFQAAGPLPAADPTVADADLVRARRALRVRQARRVGAGSGLAAIAACGALAIAAPGVLPGFGTTAPSATAPSAAAVGTGEVPAATPLAGTSLVSYTGKQPVGYTLDKVPTGWKVLSVDTGTLLLGPENAPEDDTPEGMTSFEGRIAVMQEGEESFPSGIPMDKITVNGRPGVIAHMEGGGDTRTLFVKQPSGVYLSIQVWGGLGWSNDQTVEFAEGVHVEKGATVSVG